MENIKQGILLFTLTFAFWGMLYPQFSFVEESYEVADKIKNPGEDFVEILNADPGELVIKSKILELLTKKR